MHVRMAPLGLGWTPFHPSGLAGASLLWTTPGFPDTVTETSIIRARGASGTAGSVVFEMRICPATILRRDGGSSSGTESRWCSAAGGGLCSGIEENKQVDKWPDHAENGMTSNF